MLIEKNPLNTGIDNFYGYGSWHARFWFIGYEEGGGEVPEEVADKLNYFHKVHAQADGALCDIRELYKYVAVRWDGPKANSLNNLDEYRLQQCKQHGAWKISSLLYTVTDMRNFLIYWHTSNTLFYRRQRTARH